MLPAAGVEVLKPYQTARLTGFTNPDSDPGGLTYNVTQSSTAVGAGGLSGRGVEGASQTRLDYLPEHATDFVFASFAEQRGFVGTSILLLLYLLVVWRGLRVVTVAGDLYGAVVAGGIVFAFLFQVFVNVGMTMGIAPVTGIPLPVRHGRRLLDGREPPRGRRAAGDPRARPRRGGASAARHRDRPDRRARPRDAPTRELVGAASPSRVPAPESSLQRSPPAATPARSRSTATRSRAAVAIRLVDGEPSAAETAVLRRISRAGTPLIVVRRGGGGRIPYVLAGDVLEVGTASCRSPSSRPRSRASRTTTRRRSPPACRCSGTQSHGG